MSVKTFGMVGLGAMGGPMARNMVRAGLPLVVFDLDAGKVDAMRSLGAVAAASAAEVARRAEAVILMVETTDQVRSVILGRSGLMEAGSGALRIAVMGTVSPSEIKKLGTELEQRGVGLIDAPVSGGTERALDGSLAIFASGAPEVIDAFEPAFQAVGKHVFRLGDLGQGTAVKLINNMLMQVNAVAVAEGMALAMRAGLDPQQLLEIIKVSTGNSVAFQMRAPRMIARDFSPGGTMDISFKDQELETAFAKELGVPMFLAAVTQQIYQMGRSMGYAKEDGSALIKVYERLSLPPPASSSTSKQGQP